MTIIPSEFDLIAIERRADRIEEVAYLLQEIAADEEEDGLSCLAERTRQQSYVVRDLALDVAVLVAAIREMREGGRVFSALPEHQQGILPTQ